MRPFQRLAAALLSSPHRLTGSHEEILDRGKGKKKIPRRNRQLQLEFLEARQLLASIGIPDWTATETPSDNDFVYIERDGDYCYEEEPGSGIFSGLCEITVEYVVAASGDHDLTSGSFTMEAAYDSNSPGFGYRIDFQVIEDTYFEPGDTIEITLYVTDTITGTYYDGTGSPIYIGIEDNDAPPIEVQAAGNAVESTGTGTPTPGQFIVSRLDDGNSEFYPYSSFDADFEVLGGGDYECYHDAALTIEGCEGYLTFEPYEMSKDIYIVPINNNVHQGDRTISLMVTATGYDYPLLDLIPTATASILLMDDDPVPTITIYDWSGVEDPGGFGNTASFSVQLSNPTIFEVEVDYASADGTAKTAPPYLDYDAVIGTITIPGCVIGGSCPTGAGVLVSIRADSKHEDNETFSVNLSNAVNATIGDGTGVGTIIDNDDPPTISINDVSVNEGAGNATFTVSLSKAPGKLVTVSYATQNGTAIAPDDYTSQNGTLTFDEADIPSTSKTISVPIIDDSDYEPAEIFYVNLSNPQYATISDGQGIGTIIDDDPPPALSIADASVSEDEPIVTLTVTLDRKSYQDVSVNYATSDDTAKSTADYTTETDSVTIPAGETSATFTVEISPDNMDEFDETFFVTLSMPTNATIDDGSATVTIIDDDDPPTVSIYDVSFGEGIGTAGFVVMLSAMSGKPISVKYTAADGSAVQPSDYSASSATLTFDAETTVLFQSAEVPIVPDSIGEANEFFYVNLSDLSNVDFGDGQAVGTILDDEPRLSITAVDDVAYESPGALDTGLFVITASGLGSAIQAQLLISGSASNGIDYGAISSSITISGTETYIDVIAVNDALREGPEDVYVTILMPSNSPYVVDGSGTDSVTIYDNDEWTVGINAITSTAFEILEETLVYTIYRYDETDTSFPLVVSFGVAVAGTADEGLDFQPLSVEYPTQTVTIPENEFSTTVYVHTLDDWEVEGSETVILSVNATPDYAVESSTSSATGTIVSDDVEPQKVPCGCPDCPEKQGPGQLPAKNCTPGDSGWTDYPIRYADGAVMVSSHDLESGGFGTPWGITRSWTNRPGYSPQNIVGHGMVISEQPFLVRNGTTGTIGVVTNGYTVNYFDPVGNGYQAQGFELNKFSYDEQNNEHLPLLP